MCGTVHKLLWSFENTTIYLYKEKISISFLCSSEDILDTFAHFCIPSG